jgi:cobalt-zinc-cadmium efflux system protein
MHFHVDKALQKRYILSIILTFLILIAEIIGGIISGSLALLSDAAHVFMDIFALALSFFAMRLAARPPDDRHSFGWHRAEVMAAMINGSSLGIMAIGIWVEAFNRFRNPVVIRSTEMLIIAVIGLVVNLVVAWILGGHTPMEKEHPSQPSNHAPRENLNQRSAFLHVLGDAISSVGVIMAAILIQLTGANWLDPLISVLIGIIIVVSAWRVLRGSLHILLEGVPEGLFVSKINTSLRSIPAITNVHDLHIWNLSSNTVALSAHITLANDLRSNHEEILARVNQLLDQEFNIQHTTIQFETTPCQNGNGGCN